MFSANQLFDIDKTLAGVYLSGVKHPWEVLPEIKSIAEAKEDTYESWDLLNETFFRMVQK